MYKGDDIGRYVLLLRSSHSPIGINHMFPAKQNLFSFFVCIAILVNMAMVLYRFLSILSTFAMG
jgi:hypothetical protein